MVDKRAIISDVHGNLEALTAVLADIHDQGITQIYCLGDIVGYGPNPCECIDHVMKMDMCILGNHDQAALFDPEGFSSGAERAIFGLENSSSRLVRRRRIRRACRFYANCHDNITKGMPPSSMVLPATR